MSFSPNAALVWRDFKVDGVPSSGRHKPKKSEIRTLLALYEAVLLGQLRTAVTSLQLFVDGAAGDDANAGTAGGSLAKKTLQSAWTSMYRDYDLKYSPPTVKVKDGNYAGFIAQGYMVGYHFAYLEGETTGGVVITPPAGQGACVQLGDGAIVIAKKTKVQSTASGQFGWFGHQPATILDLFEGNEIGAFPGGVGIANDQGGVVMNIGDDLIVSGSAAELARLTAGGVMTATGAKSIVFKNTLTFTNLFNANAAGSNILFGPSRAFSYSGGATVTISGRALQCSPGSAISKGGNTFPSAASADGGGGSIY